MIVKPFNLNFDHCAADEAGYYEVMQPASTDKDEEHLDNFDLDFGDEIDEET